MASKCQNPTRAYSQLETEWVGVGVALRRLLDLVPKVSTKDRAMLPFRACVSACFRASSYSSYSLRLATKVQRNKETYRGASEEKKKTYFGHFVSSLFGIEPHDRQNADFLQNEN